MFNELFKKTMKQDKISGKELAARLGVPPANVSYYLQKGSWEESKMREYAAALGYDLSITLVRRSGVSAPAIPEPTTQTQPREETPAPALHVYSDWQLLINRGYRPTNATDLALWDKMQDFLIRGLPVLFDDQLSLNVF